MTSWFRLNFLGACIIRLHTPLMIGPGYTAPGEVSPPTTDPCESMQASVSAC